MESKLKLLSRLVVWVSDRLARLQEPTVVNVEPESKLYELVKTKMENHETDTTNARIKSLEKVVQHLSHQLYQTNEENKLQRELLLHMSTNVEELMNVLSSETYEQEPEEDHTWHFSPTKKLGTN